MDQLTKEKQVNSVFYYEKFIQLRFRNIIGITNIRNPIKLFRLNS